MNKTDLMKDLYKVLKESGWLDKATKHFQEHPEYFEKGKYNHIASLYLTISFQPQTLLEIPEVNPNVSVELFNGDIWNSLYIGSNDYKKISTAIKSNNHLETVTEVCVNDI